MKSQRNSPSFPEARSVLSEKARELITLKKQSEVKHYTQEFINVEDILDGFIYLADGRVLDIVEILPVNFHEESDFVKDSIMDSFGSVIKNLPRNGHFKVMSGRTDLTSWEKYVREQTASETSNPLLMRIEDYISHTKQMQAANSVHKRFFYICEYEGDDKGNRSDDYTEVHESMYAQHRDILNAFSICGNLVIDYRNNPTGLLEILYEFYNPNSCLSDNFKTRQAHVLQNFKYIEDTRGIEKEPCIADLIAPRGIRMGKWDYLLMDGIYHRYYILKDLSFPQHISYAWVDSIARSLPDGDVDIFINNADTGMNSYFLDRYAYVQKGQLQMYANSGDEAKKEKFISKAQNALYLKSMIDQGESLYEVSIIITIRAYTLRELNYTCRDFLKQMGISGYHFDSCFLNTDIFFKMVSPLSEFSTQVFNSNKRNMTNSALASLYMFTSFEMFSYNAPVFGLINKAGAPTMFGLDIFKKGTFPNPHMCILGTSGAGKTFAEMAITSRLRFDNTQIMYILPLKGDAYEDNVRSLGGSFIQLRPGSPNCINICEIRPSAYINLDELDEESRYELRDAPPLLAQKVTSLITWTQMLMGTELLTKAEEGELNAMFMKVYEDFGFTQDNASIWNADGSLKKMPIISDLFNAIKDNPNLARISSVMRTWVDGNCSNMNGQTNVDLTSKVLAFDINEDLVGEGLLPAFMFIAFDTSYAIAQRSRDEKCCICLDEVWKMLNIEPCAKHIQKMVKILREYTCALLCATQDIADFMRNSYARALVSNSAVKIFMRATHDEIKAMGDIADFSEENKSRLENLPSGAGYICYGRNRIPIRFELSLLEMEKYEPKKSEKARLRDLRIAQERANKQLNNT